LKKTKEKEEENFTSWALVRKAEKRPEMGHEKKDTLPYRDPDAWLRGGEGEEFQEKKTFPKKDTESREKDDNCRQREVIDLVWGKGLPSEKWTRRERFSNLYDYGVHGSPVGKKNEGGACGTPGGKLYWPGKKEYIYRTDLISRGRGIHMRKDPPITLFFYKGEESFITKDPIQENRSFVVVSGTG